MWFIKAWKVGGDPESEEHNVGFEKPEWCDKGGFPSILWFDEDVVVFPSDVELGEDVRSFEFIHEFRDTRKGIRVLRCVGVEIPVVLAGS